MSRQLPRRLRCAANQLLVVARCWSCQAVVRRRIHPGLRRTSLAWSCPGCEVSWSALGEEPDDRLQGPTEAM